VGDSAAGVAVALSYAVPTRGIGDCRRQMGERSVGEFIGVRRRFRGSGRYNPGMRRHGRGEGCATNLGRSAVTGVAGVGHKADVGVVGVVM
jgi:hypothetical protein